MTIGMLYSQLQKLLFDDGVDPTQEFYASYNYGDHFHTEAIKPVSGLEEVTLSKTGYANNELKIGHEWARWCVDENPDYAPFGAPEAPTEAEQPKAWVLR